MVDHHAVVSDAEWAEARKALLLKEKELTKAYEALWKERAALPWRLVPKNYVFQDLAGKDVHLSDLFEGDKKTLIVVHLMFGPDWERPCSGCSFWADGYSGELPHLLQRVNFVAVSMAAPEKLAALAKTKNWTFPYYSSQGTTFNHDFGVSFSKDEVAEGIKAYDYGRAPYSTENQGISVFRKGIDGKVYHTYSTFARGIELMNCTMTFLDITPEGRYGGENFSGWMKHKEDY